MTAPFTSASAAGWALLDACRAGALQVSRKGASFIGETAIDPTPLSERQAAWLARLLEQAGLPPMEGGSRE